MRLTFFCRDLCLSVQWTASLVSGPDFGMGIQRQTARHPHACRRFGAAMSTPERTCIVSPEQKYINEAGKKAPELGAFSLEVKRGWDYPPAYPSWRGVSGA